MVSRSELGAQKFLFPARSRRRLGHAKKGGTGGSSCRPRRPNQVSAGGKPPFDTGLSAEEILTVPVERRRKTTAEECPFCADSPIKENGSKCVGICRNPQNTPGPEVGQDCVRIFQILFQKTQRGMVA